MHRISQGPDRTAPRRTVLRFVTLLCCCGALLSCDAPERPNIVLILADDLGVMDVCAYAQDLAPGLQESCPQTTPNIDVLARQGVMFRRAYATPLCSPSRASLLNGVLGPRQGFNNALTQGNVQRSYFHQRQPPDPGYGIHDTVRRTAASVRRPLVPASSSTALAPDPDRPSLPMALPDHASAFIGKWHVGGGVEGHQPRDHGFKEIAYSDEGFSDYFDWASGWQEPGDPEERYLTDDITAQAVAWLRRPARRRRPFFLLVSHFAPHSPFQAKATYAAGSEETQDIYRAMVRSLDDSVGQIVAELEALNLRDNTLLIFASDNGAVASAAGKPVTSNHPFRGEKAWIFEGGIRIPLILSWPRGLSSAQRVDTPVDLTDILPTLLQAGNYDGSAYAAYGDGQSLLGLAADADGTSRASTYAKPLFFYDPFYRSDADAATALYESPKSAIIEDNWKLIFYHQGYLELYDLDADPYEHTNLAASRRDIVHRLFAKLSSWEATIPPRYRTRPNPDYRADAASRLPPFRADPLAQP